MESMTDRLRKREVWGIMALLVFHVFVFPLGLAIATLSGWDSFGLSEGQINIAYYGIGIVLALVFAGRYLRRSFDSLLDRPGDAIKYFFITWAVYLGMNYILNVFLLSIPFFSGDNPNQAAIENIAVADRSTVLAMTVFMAPFVEEVIFRGGIFCGLYHKNRILAYVISIAVFCLYHVWQFALFLDVRMLLYALQYLPAAFALCFCYEKSGSLWTCIFFHMSVNALGMLLM